MNTASDNNDDFGDLSRTAITRQIITFQNWRLTFPTPHLAVFEKTPKFRTFLPVVRCILIIVAILPPLIFWLVVRGSTNQFLWLALAAIAAENFIVALVLYFAVIHPVAAFRPPTFDKLAGKFWRDGKRDPIIGDGSPLANIAAVQIVARKAMGKGLFLMYEVNLVLRQPAGRRTCAICHSDEETIRQDAQNLADFLQSPLLDHTT
ncbi:MAG: hypothetical protein EHM48_07990 [Planctomycetaceae bacterium]|nr:MAG: hypothetical protein EHM48_07990 [Planctomycetaceae bacterium]